MIKTDSIKYQLLEMVGLCGEFPSEQLNRLIESDSYAEKVVTDLKQSKLIRTHYKDGLRGYRLTKRAKELLLSTDNSIENIGVQLGYYNYTYFMKVFKRSTGMSPGQYRKQYGK